MDGVVCGKKQNARGMCMSHYNKWKRHGDPHFVQKFAEGCKIEGCDRPHKSLGFCDLHYDRNHRLGDPGPAELMRQPGRTCSFEGCDKKHDAQGYCSTHYQRLKVHGDVNATLLPQRGTDDITYLGAHQRVYRAKGKAVEYDCVDCGGPASEWSYDHADPNEKLQFMSTNRGDFDVPYSVNPDHYDPRCKPCHVVYDSKSITEYQHTQEVAQ